MRKQCTQFNCSQPNSKPQSKHIFLLISILTQQMGSRSIAYAHMVLMHEGYAVNGYEERLQTVLTSAQLQYHAGTAFSQMIFAGITLRFQL